MMNEKDVIELWLPISRRLIYVYNKDDQVSDHQSGLALDRALGLTEFALYCERSRSQDRPMPNGPLKELLKQLNGPYGNTILKAYQAKRGFNVLERS